MCQGFSLLEQKNIYLKLNAFKSLGGSNNIIIELLQLMQSAQGMLHQLLKNMPKHNSLEYKTYPRLSQSVGRWL